MELAVLYFVIYFSLIAMLAVIKGIGGYKEIALKLITAEQQVSVTESERLKFELTAMNVVNDRLTRDLEEAERELNILRTALSKKTKEKEKIRGLDMLI